MKFLSDDIMINNLTYFKCKRKKHRYSEEIHSPLDKINFYQTLNIGFSFQLNSFLNYKLVTILSIILKTSFLFICNYSN